MDWNRAFPSGIDFRLHRSSGEIRAVVKKKAEIWIGRRSAVGSIKTRTRSLPPGCRADETRHKVDFSPVRRSSHHRPRPPKSISTSVSAPVAIISERFGHPHQERVNSSRCLLRHQCVPQPFSQKLHRYQDRRRHDHPVITSGASFTAAFRARRNFRTTMLYFRRSPSAECSINGSFIGVSRQVRGSYVSADSIYNDLKVKPVAVFIDFSDRITKI